MNPYPNFNPAQPYPPQGGLGFLKAMSTKAKLLIVGAVAVVGPGVRSIWSRTRCNAPQRPQPSGP
jgi:hypothetical protein